MTERTYKKDLDVLNSVSLTVVGVLTMNGAQTIIFIVTVVQRWIIAGSCGQPATSIPTGRINDSTSFRVFTWFGTSIVVVGGSWQSRYTSNWWCYVQEYAHPTGKCSFVLSAGQLFLIVSLNCAIDLRGLLGKSSRGDRTSSRFIWKWWSIPATLSRFRATKNLLHSNWNARIETTSSPIALSTCSRTWVFNLDGMRCDQTDWFYFTHFLFFIELLEHYTSDHIDRTDCQGTLVMLSRTTEKIKEQLAESENFILLCELQRDISGFDKLVQMDRLLIRQGCLLKHSKRGLQQRMFFLVRSVEWFSLWKWFFIFKNLFAFQFSDVLLYGCKSPVTQAFKILGHVPVRSMLTENAEHNAFIIFGGQRAITVIFYLNISAIERFIHFVFRYRSVLAQQLKRHYG